MRKQIRNVSGGGRGRRYRLPKSSAGVALDFWLFAGDQRDERRDAAEQPRLLLDWVAVVAQVLQVGGRVGLHHGVRIVQKGDDLVQVGISPPDTCQHNQTQMRVIQLIDINFIEIYVPNSLNKFIEIKYS